MSHSPKVGIWLIGAKGGISTVLAVGLSALKRKWCRPIGLLTEAEEWKGRDGVELDRLVLGGHEIRPISAWESAKELQAKSRLFSDDLLRVIKPDLREYDRSVKAGYPAAEARMPEAIQRDLETFRRTHRLDQVVVVNVASTEPQSRQEPKSEQEWLTWLKRPGRVPLSAVYAYAAMKAGCHYVNFTPSVGSSWRVLQETAEMNRVLHMGRDGKTGETLVKTTLAVMFRVRNLEVMSWTGFNILGDRDGETLQHRRQKASKVSTKAGVLKDMLGYQPHAFVGIEYVPSLHEWKTAWDFIHFKGFLETPMAMQFTWQGCDAVLAAPLVLDLARLTAGAACRGERGLMPWLACFFKAPEGVREHHLFKQVEMLHRHMASWGPIKITKFAKEAKKAN